MNQRMNDWLLAEFKGDEIRLAVKEMGSMKASGYDGFPGIFYQHFWPLIGIDITQFCLKVLKREIPMEKINFTKIVLIPKTNMADTMSLFRSISLCFVLFKIISKVLAN